MHIVFYGPEGSGKGTQANLLAKKLNIPLLVSGDLVRMYAKQDKGIMGNTCREALTKGHYVADSEMYVLWKQRFKEKDTQNGWIVDGFPRNLTQAKFLARKVEKYSQELDAVFFLDVPEKVSINRLIKRGRKNPSGELHDSPQRIKQRLGYYNRSKAGVIKYYTKRGILEKVNGDRSRKDISQDILKRVNEFNNK